MQCSAVTTNPLLLETSRLPPLALVSVDFKVYSSHSVRPRKRFAASRTTNLVNASCFLFNETHFRLGIQPTERLSALNPSTETILTGSIHPKPGSPYWSTVSSLGYKCHGAIVRLSVSGVVSLFSAKLEVFAFFTLRRGARSPWRGRRGMRIATL